MQQGFGRASDQAFVSKNRLLVQYDYRLEQNGQLFQGEYTLKQALDMDFLLLHLRFALRSVKSQSFIIEL
jgi:hypothetical protein